MVKNYNIAFGIAANLAYGCTSEAAHIYAKGAVAHSRLDMNQSVNEDVERCVLVAHCNMFVRGATEVVPRLPDEMMQYLIDHPVKSKNLTKLLQALQA